MADWRALRLARQAADVTVVEVMEPQAPPVKVRRLLHIFASFGSGGVPFRMGDVMNALPAGFQHTIVALDGCFDARRRMAATVDAQFRALSLPRYNLLSSAARIRDLVADAHPDLLLTYNWGAIEAALVNRFAGFCEHIHFESGFGAEEGDGQIGRRNFVRRIALARARKVVVPSATLMRIAAEAWAVPADRLLQIPNGVDWRRYNGEPGVREQRLTFGVDRRATVIGTVAPLRPEKNVGRLIAAFAAMPQRAHCRLVIAGDGAEMAKLRLQAQSLGIAQLTSFLGHVDDVPSVLRSLDVFALSSDTEQMPNSLLQAMAAGRPVAAVEVGDVASIVAPENRPLVVPRDAEGAFAGALSALVDDPARRATLGHLNQIRARSSYNLEGMVSAYAALLGAR